MARTLGDEGKERLNSSVRRQLPYLYKGKRSCWSHSQARGHTHVCRELFDARTRRVGDRGTYVPPVE